MLEGGENFQIVTGSADEKGGRNNGDKNKLWQTE